MMVSFWVPYILGRIIMGTPKRDQNLDNQPYIYIYICTYILYLFLYTLNTAVRSLEFIRCVACSAENRRGSDLSVLRVQGFRFSGSGF